MKIKKILGTIILVLFTIIGLNISVYADITDNTSVTYVDSDYNVITEFAENTQGQGDITYKVNADLSQIDEIYIPYRLGTDKCCNNQN